MPVWARVCNLYLRAREIWWLNQRWNIKSNLKQGTLYIFILSRALATKKDGQLPAATLRKRARRGNTTPLAFGRISLIPVRTVSVHASRLHPLRMDLHNHRLRSNHNHHGANHLLAQLCHGRQNTLDILATDVYHRTTVPERLLVSIRLIGKISNISWL